MRVYKFLTAEFGLKSLSEKRLKISTLEDLNDPFELLPYDLSDRTHRMAVRMTRDYFSRTWGMLCFSSNWRDPVLWAHYADKHKGICIGFDIPDEMNITKRVNYVSERLPFPESLSIEHSDALLYTKYSSWAYEEEVRVFLTIEDQENGLYFRGFDDSLRPVLIIAGARWSGKPDQIVNALGPLATTVKTIKARAGFTRFEIVEDQRGFSDKNPTLKPISLA